MRSHHTWRLKSKHQQICSRCGQVRRWNGTRWLYRKHGELVRQRPTCGEKRTDSERYAELRKLVEAWQEAHRQHDQARTTAPETDGWLKRWLNFCDAQKPLLDWRHR